MTEQFDITIIGGGPAGMFAAFYAGMNNAKTQVIESLAELGGQVNALYPEKTILDVAGLPAVSGRDLIANQQKQNAQFPLTVKTGETVTNVTATADGFTITTPAGTSQNKAVIVAIGNGAFAPRKLNVATADDLTDKHLFYSVRNLERFRDKTVMVAGGGDAAIDQALMLEPVAKSVTLLHRRAQFRGLPHMVDLLHESSVHVQTPYLIRDLAETSAGLDVTLKPVGQAGDPVHTTVDDLVVSYGFTSDHSALAKWDVQLAEIQRLIAVDSTMATSVDGIYAIGDGVTYPGKQPLIATGYGEAPVAVRSIMTRFFPDHHGPVHSTSLDSKLL